MTRIAVLEKDKIKDKGLWYDSVAPACPINRAGNPCMYKSDDGDIGIDEALCIGCGICVRKDPYQATHIINLPEELDEQPIHQFGRNGFHLYNLPIPIFGKVVGIIGRNGIGKSTAIKILAGVLNPNMGNLRRKKVRIEELIEFFKGTEAQAFFEKVRNKEITVSYKPQQVDLIPAQYKGTVKELLEKIDEKKELEKISEMLDIQKVLDHDIKDISGGELQRVAIAACVLKKANLYIFDEPTSYLDIKQRIKISKFIRSLADEQTAVIVVEHDLIILDYIADLVNLMYGKSACYGVVSQPKSTRAGINVYLSGYLKEENMRFRDHEIKFHASAPSKAKKAIALTDWEGIDKTLGSFHLSAPKGTIYHEQVNGVLGENGIGKTTFMKILAGVEKQDKGNISKKVKISYKPQYLGSSKEPVAGVLKDALKKYEAQLIRPLEIKGLLDKNINELSGGELQRVAIALCLSQDADLYLLDEPSAYLDVEQRLAVTKIIKDLITVEHKAAIVIDHDLLFIDYLSEELIVVDGVPAEHGVVQGPFSMEKGMNKFLSDLGLTFRRDEESYRPRANKPNSQMDRKQKAQGKLYYT